MIKLDNITKTFGRKTALKDISFQLKEGEITAFIGPNGAGKTTTMKIITQTLVPSSGSFEILGHTVSTQTESKIPLKVRQSIGYLAENNPLYEDMIAGEYLRTCAGLHGFSKSQSRLAVSEVVQSCQLEQVINQSVSTLSKGYRQRLGVAQALVHNPDILILDEPTSGLDPNQAGDFLTMLSSLKGKTILFSTHILHAVPQFCQHLIFIHNGSIQFDGTPAEFMSGQSSMERAFRQRCEVSA
ncbi:MAG: multidrug ABC transporter ATP-binding protein [Acidobacteria bacterium]|nr:MAG: multidrug ABC transporter ATP-binding protein [Acidobacteriota bacterium]